MWSTYYGDVCDLAAANLVLFLYKWTLSKWVPGHQVEMEQERWLDSSFVFTTIWPPLPSPSGKAAHNVTNMSSNYVSSVIITYFHDSKAAGAPSVGTHQLTAKQALQRGLDLADQ